MFHIDFETYSPLPLKTHGAYRYAAHPDARILMMGIARDSGPVRLWVHPECETSELRSDPRAQELIDEMCTSDEPISAHYAPFECAVSRYLFKKSFGYPCPHPSRWRCTAAMARRAGLPDQLEKLCEVLELPVRKDARGKALIQKFSIPNKKGQRVMPQEDPKAFAQYGEYCITDVRAEQAVARDIHQFALQDTLLQIFQFDMEMNDRGIPVNRAALLNARKILSDVWADVAVAFKRKTGLGPGQREAVRKLLFSKGIALPNMKADTLEDILERKNLPAEGREILEMYSQLQFAAVKKIKTMLDMACPEDNFVRGCLLFYGAGTGRWAGRGIQPQNFKRPTLKDMDMAYKMICAGCGREELDMIWGNAVEVLSSCIRNFIQWMRGDMLDADYSAVEARIVNWLAGQEDVLEEFRQGKDTYRGMAAVIYNRAIEDILNPSEERELGKRTILGCGFNMGAPKFRTTCWNQYRIRISKDMSERCVYAYRDKHDKVVRLWSLCDTAARNAIARPGLVCKAGDKLTFEVRRIGKFDYLLMRLPSGRSIAYPQPKVEKVYNEQYREWRSAITFFGEIKNGQWGRVSTYGGKLVENATQGTAFDLMGHGALVATSRGFKIITLIHDQAPAFRLPGQTPEDYVRALTDLPSWAKGLPIKAEGRVIPYYKK